MARTKFKWKLAIFFYLILVNVFTKSLPIETKLPSLITTDTLFKNAEIPKIANILKNSLSTTKVEDELLPTETPNIDNSTETINGDHIDIIPNTTNKSLLRQYVRPDQNMQEYAIEITPNGDSFTGRAVISLELTLATREEPIRLHCENLDIQSVLAGVFSEVNAIPASFNVDEGVLEIEPDQIASTYILIITYTGIITNSGEGLYRGQFDDFNYLAMNLHPTNARRVFPCVDEPTESSIISFTYNDIEYDNLVSNSLLEDNTTQFRALEGPPHLWSMAAHNFQISNLPTNNVYLYIRPEIRQQNSHASVAINYFFNTLNDWTAMSYFGIQVNQDPQLNIFALPDVNVDWYGLSMVGIWEPYILMENICSVKQRYAGLVKMAESLSRQWFGHVIYPQHWQEEWVVSGMASYAAWDILRTFQTSTNEIDNSLLDVNTLFVTDVIQESLYQDGYANAQILAPGSNIFDEGEIRNNIHGILKYKSPALFRMLRLIIGDENRDIIRSAGRTLLSGRALQTVNSLHFIDAINSDYLTNGNGMLEDIEEYLEPWTQENGYPVIYVGMMQRGVLVSQDRFGFSNRPNVGFQIPLTYTVSTNPNYEVIHPDRDDMMDGNVIIPMDLEEEDVYVLFNIQGQGYYRVNYDNDLWERIIEALRDPDRRQEIHPLNRATLTDDSLNLARAGEIDYEIAFEVVLTMEHETEYAPWKAFLRNMNFLRKQLIALVEEDEDLDPNIYLRMVQRSIGAFEDEIGFSPNPSLNEAAMVSLTRGLVMDHACRANYQPCVAAAVDWFWDQNDGENVVNPNIPADLRPAVFCTMVREGDDEIIMALNDRLDIEPSMYERVVILESMACSRDENFVRLYLEETVASNSPYTPEEGLSIFKAVAGASYQNSWIALNFLMSRTNDMRSRYGPAKLEEALYALVENLPESGQVNDFNIWLNSQSNFLDSSEGYAGRIGAMLTENQRWQDTHLDYVYEWINENDAPTLIASSILLFASCIIALFNN